MCSMVAMTRKSVPIDAGEHEFVRRLRTPGSRERAALRAAAGIDLPDDASEAEILHALLAVGRHTVDEQLLDEGYAALAAAETDEDRAVHHAMRARSARAAARES